MENFKFYLEKYGEYGEVIGIKHLMVKIEGLPKAKVNEVVVFENGGIGQIIDIDRTYCQVALLQKNVPKVKDRVSRTNALLTIPVNQDFLGTMIDPLGTILYPDDKKISKRESRLVETEIGGIEKRAKITKQLLTGVTMIDMLLPIGNGQKELIVGDRKTGKTSLLLTTVKNQIRLGKIVIFASIGKKKTDINRLLNYFISENIFNKMIFVVSSSDDPENLIYLTPYTAVTMAEYFKDQGQDTLVILDDLSSHAKIYRQIALNSNKFPGRESYPGDIFYLHAHLLERTGSFKLDNKQEVSITCLPVAETIEGDLSGYITTNLMGITDGHIYFDQSIFTKGRRPAVNLPLSVTRVGRQTQTIISQQANQEITAFLAEYESLLNLSHFGAELSTKVKTIIKKGERIFQVFDQRYQEIVPQPIQLILLTIAYLEEFFEVDMIKLKEKLIKEQNSEWLEKLISQITSLKSYEEVKKYLVSNRKLFID